MDEKCKSCKTVPGTSLLIMCRLKRQSSKVLQGERIVSSDHVRAPRKHVQHLTSFEFVQSIEPADEEDKKE